MPKSVSTTDVSSAEHDVAAGALAPDTPELLTRAVARAAALLRVPPLMVAHALELPPAEGCRLCAGGWYLDLRHPAWPRALLFVRLFRAICVQAGSVSLARHWLHTPNRAFETRPFDLLLQKDGLERLVAHLEATR